MTVTMLRAGMSTVCPPGAFEIDWQVAGSPTADVSVGIESLNVPGEPAAAVRSIGDQRLLLTGLPAAVTLTVRPRRDGTVFGDAVTFEAQLAMHTTDDDGDQLILDPIDVSGTACGVLLTIAPASGGWSFTAAQPGRSASGTTAQPGRSASGTTERSATTPAAATVPDFVAVDSLGSDGGTLMQRVVWAARRCAGAQSLPADRLSTLVLAVDRSASMVTHQRSGALHSILELLLGINAVCGAERAIAVWALGSGPAPIRPDLSEASLGDYVRTALGDQDLTSGTAFAPLVEVMPAASAPQTVYVVTDDVPPDLAETAAALRTRSDRRWTVPWRLLVLARGRTDPRVRAEPWRDELQSLTPLLDEGLVTISTITPNEQPGWLAEQLSTSDRLDAVVRDLGNWPATVMPDPTGRRR